MQKFTSSNNLNIIADYQEKNHKLEKQNTKFQEDLEKCLTANQVFKDQNKILSQKVKLFFENFKTYDKHVVDI